jgi:hypothetical protein
LTSIACGRFNTASPIETCRDVNKNANSARTVRKHLDHSTHYAARFVATFFITICCETRAVNQLCRKPAAAVLFETARRYDVAQKSHLKVLLLMPDHLHMLLGVPGDANLSNLMRDFKPDHHQAGGHRMAAELF